MSYKEKDIVHENEKAWVLRDLKGKAYVVFVKGPSVSTSDSAYELTEDGLSIAKARADYFLKR